MKRRIQQGFTLIEVMIVVAIIGILAVVSIPAYQDYMVRARVTEGLLLAAPAKTLVVDNAINANPFAQGWTPPATTKAVNGIVIADETGEITITYASAAGNGTLILSPRDGGPAGVALSGTSAASTVPVSGQITWNCKSAGSAKLGGTATLIAKFAPAECRK